MRRFKTLATAYKCPEMPQRSIFWQYIYTRLPCFLDYTVSTTVHNLNLIQVATRESPETPLQLNKTWFCGSLFKKPKLCLLLWHAHRNSSFSKDGFSATCWSCSNLTEKAAIFDLPILARRTRRVSLCDVTAHGRVQEWPSRKRLGTRLQPTNKSVDFLCCALREFCS